MSVNKKTVYQRPKDNYENNYYGLNFLFKVGCGHINSKNRTHDVHYKIFQNVCQSKV